MRTIKEIELSQLDGQSVAVVLDVEGCERIISGIGRYERGGKNGGCLLVQVQEGDVLGNPSLIIRESGFAGEIKPDLKEPCSFVLHLN
jgi:hypothetical protein